MESEDTPLVYGLELSSRCICSQVGETAFTRFLVGSQSFKQENQVHLLEYDDETNQLTKNVFTHNAGAICDISASYEDDSLFTTCHQSYSDSKLHHGCTLWRLPSQQQQDQYEEDQLSSGGITKLATIDDVTHAVWRPVEGESSLMGHGGGGGVMDLYDVTEELKKQCSFKLPSKKKAGKGRWNPHHGSKQFSVCVGNQVICWDIRADEQAFALNSHHEPVVRDLDYNPNKQYYMLTCGDDSCVRFWDVRNIKEPLSTAGEGDHHHWITSARYNPFHDQLVLSCGTDHKVVLHDKSSVSSEPYNYQHDNDDDSDDSSDEFSQQKEAREDGVVGVFEDHEESVYGVEWSSMDPWSFASISYDGRLVVNKVPKNIKFDILL